LNAREVKETFIPAVKTVVEKNQVQQISITINFGGLFITGLKCI